MTSEVDTMDDTEQTGVSNDAGTPGENTTDADTTAATVGDPRPSKSRQRWLWRAAVLVAAVAVLAGGVFGYFKYRSTADELAAVRQSETDRHTAAQLARAYALKSLTYSFENPDAFFRSVEEGVSPALKDKFVNATGFLKSLMLQAQVASTGEVVATDPIPQPGDVYEVVVSAYQTTRNLQNPQPRVSVMLLQVTVNKVGDTWQISDIGPKPGSQRPDTEQVPLPKAGS